MSPFKTCRAAAMLSCVTLMGCAVGPNFGSPCPPKTKTYTDKPQPTKTTHTLGKAGKAQYFLSGKDIPAEWWKLFHSKELNCLIEQGMKNSPTVEAAQAALRQAQHNVRFGIAALFPTLTGTGSFLRQRASGVSFDDTTRAPVSTFNLFNATVNVAYTLDVFGGTRRTIEALCALEENQEFILEGTYLTLAANIATAAITEASLRQQIEATHDLIRLNAEQLDIIKKQFELGGVSRTDVLTQETQLAEIRATLPPLEKSLAQIRNGLAVLVGILPSRNNLPEFSMKHLTLPTQLPISIPSLLVRQRPDIRASEALLHQASALVGVATANMLPQINITGNYGNLSNSWGNLFTGPSNIWSIGSQLTQTLFDAGALTSQRRAAIAAYEQAGGQYRQTVLQAFQNVADSLRALELDAQNLKARTEAEVSAKETYFLAKEQFKLGALDFLLLLNAERTYQQERIRRIQAEALRYNDTVALFQALGGGWWNRCDCIETKKCGQDAN